MAKLKTVVANSPSGTDVNKKTPLKKAPKLKSPKSTPKKHKTKFNSSSAAEAFDIDDAEGDVNVDAKEIEDYVNKLGLSNFNNISQLISANKNKVKKNDSNSPKQLKIPKEQTESIKPSKQKTLINSKKSNGVEGTSPKVNNKSRKSLDKSENDNATVNTPIQNSKQKLKMIVQTEGKWFEDEVSSVTEISQSEAQNLENDEYFEKSLTQSEIAQFQIVANGLLDADIQAYKSTNTMGKNKSDFEWTEKMMKNGTLPDRMAAFIVRIQNSPIHNLNYLQQLTSMVKVQGKQQCMMTADTLRELFLEDLLPPNRKLIPFEKRGSKLTHATKKQLIKWIFEDKLKLHYDNYIQALKRMAGDTVEKLRGKAIVIIFQLLVAHPEQESVLLQTLVNKLGDPAKKLGSRALFYLNNLLHEHPKMKMIVIEEVERLIFRKNISTRAQYYGICFLNLIKLEGEHASLAHKLITVYVAFFKSCVKTGDIDTKMMSGLLTGINRAFPQAREYGFQFTENLNTLYKIVQLSQFQIAVQSLSILFQITDVEGNPEGADRFYRVLYEKLLDVEFLTTSHNIQFLNLIFRAVKSDNDINRVTGFTKRLLQICQNCSPNLACAILFLLSEVSISHPESIRIGEKTKFEIEAEIKIEEDKETISDIDIEEQNKKHLKSRVDLKKLMKSSNIQIDTEIESSEIQIIEQTKIIKPLVDPTKESLTVPSTSLIADTLQEEDVEVKTEEKPEIKRLLTEYSPNARNPRYCGAELSLSYELSTLARHFHPSVALFAQTLANRNSIKYDGNPLKDFTLSRFLERFAYRNPKKTKFRSEYQPKGLRSVPVNSENYLQADENNIPVEEKFFYRYFKSKKESVPKIKKEDDDDLSDAESVDDDEFDDLMKNYFKSVKPDDSDGEEDVSGDDAKIDYVAGVSALKGKSKKRKSEIESEEEDDDDDEDDGDQDSGADENADDFICLDEDEEIENSEDEIGMLDFDDDEEILPSRERKAFSKKFKGGDMFAPAEEFAEMLEENAQENLSGSQTLINKDRSSHKQLKWEKEQDRRVKGYTGNSKHNYKANNKKRLKRK